MIVSLFKTRQPGFYVFLTLISIAVFLSGIRNSTLLVSGKGMPLYTLITAFSGASEHIYFIAGIFLFVIQGIQLHFLVSRFEVLYKPSFLPWLIYIVLMAAVPGMLIFSPSLLANTFLLLMFDRLFRIYKSEYAQGYHFEAAFMLSIAVCISLPAASFILLMIASMLILHPFDWRNWVSAFLGFLSPIYLLAIILFLAGRTDVLMPENYLHGFRWAFQWSNVLPSGEKVTSLFILVLYVLSIFKLRENFYKNTSRTRSFQQVVIMYGFIALLISFFTPAIPAYKFVLPAIPLAIVIGYYLLALKKNWMADTFLILLIALAIFNHLKLSFSP